MRTLDDNEGFTIVELMTVVAMVGMLASIAIPSYQSFVDRIQMHTLELLLTQGRDYLTSVALQAPDPTHPYPKTQSTQFWMTPEPTTIFYHPCGWWPSDISNSAFGVSDLC